MMIVGGAGMDSLEFAEAARMMGAVARGRDCCAPTFRSPPRSAGRTRSIRWRSDGSATVSVALRGRTTAAVLADMIEGVVVANELSAGDGASLRDDLWQLVDVLLEGASAPPLARAA